MRAAGTASAGTSGRQQVDAVSTTLPADSASAGAARRFVTSTLACWHADQLIEAAELLTSELVTNAVLHAGSAVQLRLAPTVDGIRCEVFDCGPGSPRMRCAAPEDLNGRGLQLVDLMSQAWGVALAPGGKTVWFELTAE